MLGWVLPLLCCWLTVQQEWTLWDGGRDLDWQARLSLQGGSAASLVPRCGCASLCSWAAGITSWEAWRSKTHWESQRPSVILWPLCWKSGQGEVPSWWQESLGTFSLDLFSEGRADMPGCCRQGQLRAHERQRDLSLDFSQTCSSLTAGSQAGSGLHGDRQTSSRVSHQLSRWHLNQHKRILRAHLKPGGIGLFSTQ